MKCKTHCQPSAKVPSAVAFDCTALTPVSVSGVVEAVEPLVKTVSDEVAVPAPLPETTSKW